MCVDDHQGSSHGVHPGWKRFSGTIQGKEHGDPDHVSPSEVKGDLGCVQGKCVIRLCERVCSVFLIDLVVCTGTAGT